MKTGALGDDDFQVDQPQVPGPKEQKEILTRLEKREKYPVVERKAEIGPAVKDWLTELETGEEIQLPQPVTDKGGQVLVKPASPQQPKIVLPLDEPTYKIGFTKTVHDSIRWLVEWIKRVILMFPERAVFKK
jgi:hypothetical protein